MLLESQVGQERRLGWEQQRAVVDDALAKRKDLTVNDSLQVVCRVRSYLITVASFAFSMMRWCHCVLLLSPTVEYEGVIWQ